MMNGLFASLVLVAIVCASATGNLGAVATASVESAQSAVTLALGLVGVMAFWLGMMRVLERAGFLGVLARLLRPVMIRLFPDVPAAHPAMSMMILNISANMLGLSNAATPFGLKAMTELDRLNPRKGTATDAMATFLAINTAGITLLPTTILALRVSLRSAAPGSILVPTLFASTVGTLAAIVAAFALRRLGSPAPLAADAAADAPDPKTAPALPDAPPPSAPTRRSALLGVGAALAVVASFAVALARKAHSTGDPGAALGWSGAARVAAAEWLLVLLIGAVTAYGLARRVPLYDALVTAGREAFDVAVKIIPYLVAILVAVGMLRASGFIRLVTAALEPVTSLIGMPAEVLPMAFLRSLTGSGSLGVATDLMRTHGADSLIGRMASTMYGSSETTFYVIALYFGAVQVRNGRHTLAACLIADAAAVLASVWICRVTG